jgi:hypothetical protein
MKNYSEDIDKLFGSNYRHRSLRTVFDNMSHEWSETTMEDKIMIIEKISLSDLSLADVIFRYKYYYNVELVGKKHVLSSLDESLAIILEETIKHKNK